MEFAKRIDPDRSLEALCRVEQQIFTETFDNGLTLVGERMPWLESIAFTILVPAGCIWDPADRLGLSSVACEMVQRGAGELTNRDLVNRLDDLGVERGSGVSSYFSSFTAAFPREKLRPTLEVYADILRRPRLPEDEFDEAVRTCLQEIQATLDDPASLAIEELRRQVFADPFGRPSHGTQQGVEAVTYDEVVQAIRNRYSPAPAIIGIAGNFDWKETVAEFRRLFDDWEPQDAPELVEVPPESTDKHLVHESQQTHLAVGFRAIPYAHDEYFSLRAAVGVLSDGMSSRLFQEVREKRGLCYSVFASVHSLRDRAVVMGYSGTTTERAQETLDVMLAEFRRLSDGIEQAELDRLKTQLRSTLIMQQESCRSRASNLAIDWHHLGRVRTLEELNRTIRGLSVEGILSTLQRHPLTLLSTVTYGKERLNTAGDAVVPA